LSLLDDLKADVDAALIGTLRPARLWVRETVSDGQGGSFPSYPSSLPCEGVRGSFDSVLAGLSGIPRTHAKIDIIASTLAATPKRLDIIEIEGGFWLIENIEEDPAHAVWVLECETTPDPNP